MPVDDLAQQCAQETNLYLTHKDSDSSYCFELFRRAISERDDSAWRALITQYKPSVEKWVNKWVNQHPGFSLASEEEEDFVAEAFERFWKHFTPEKFSRSQGLDAVLKYLKMCVHGATSDMGRKMRYRQFDQPLEGTEEGDPDSVEPEPTPEDLLQKDEFWQLIKSKSKDEKEYIVIYASFNLALTPREIFVEYPGEFRDIKEIYQYKANLLERLERDADFKEFARW
jgi:RNA polymerase sigma factor (sigma-70 family)